jgi:uncharacterized membrane protein YtjA (UPF0391 family)
MEQPGRKAHDGARLHVKVKGEQMLRYAVVFLIIALVAGLLGFTGIAAGAVQIAKVLFFVFLLLFVASLIVGLMRRK